MTPEQINIKIAEAFGNIVQHGCVISWRQLPSGEPEEYQLGPVPDYYNDLNACHEMEKGLSAHQQGKYLWWLAHACGQGFGERDTKTTCSPAPQRCEAFLRTLGLWEETK